MRIVRVGELLVTAGLLVSAPAAAVEPLVAVGGGVQRLDIQAPTPIAATRPVVSVDAGLHLSRTTSIRLRLRGFEADGANLGAGLLADWQPWRHLGFFGAAGLSAGRESLAGSETALGIFSALPIRWGFALRLEGAVGLLARNDFGGTAIGMGFVVERAWSR